MDTTTTAQTVYYTLCHECGTPLGNHGECPIEDQHECRVLTADEVEAAGLDTRTATHPGPFTTDDHL